MVGPIWPNLGKIGKFLVLKKITILPRGGAKFAQPGQKIFFEFRLQIFLFFKNLMFFWSKMMVWDIPMTYQS